MKYFLTFLFVLISIMPLVAQAAPVDFFGPIFPDACKCEDVQEIEGKSVSTAPGWGCVLQVVQNVIRFAISIGIVLATLALAYAGFVWMTSGANPGRREQGRTMLINVFVGLFVMLSAWLIVDFVMKSLYSEETGFGPWNSILAGTGSDQCLIAREATVITEGSLDIAFGEPGSYTGGGNNCPAADPSAMVAFPAAATSGATERATAATVNNFLSMRAAALKDGVELKVTDGYRPESEQVALWNNRANIGAVAQPCSLGGNGSNHNSGEAIDIDVGCRNGNSNCSTRTYQWLKVNGARWNFRNALPSDPVHWSPSGR